VQGTSPLVLQQPLNLTKEGAKSGQRRWQIRVIELFAMPLATSRGFLFVTLLAVSHESRMCISGYLLSTNSHQHISESFL
ncbi:MAG: hypothetical protein ACPG8W_16440, partial [Candidatus Promineifilaceae bacterium]